MTWLKTKVDDGLNAHVEEYRDEHDITKPEAVREMLRNYVESHRLENAEPEQIPEDAPRNENDDPVLEE